MSDAVMIGGLCVRRGQREVLHSVDAAFPAGSITGLLGPSGSGKTTLMRSVVGVQRVAAGTVEVLGMPAGDPRLRRRVGYLTQAPAVYTDLSVAENLEYFAQVVGAPATDVDRVVV